MYIFIYIYIYIYTYIERERGPRCRAPTKRCSTSATAANRYNLSRLWGGTGVSAGEGEGAYPHTGTGVPRS